MIAPPPAGLDEGAVHVEFDTPARCGRRFEIAAPKLIGVKNTRSLWDPARYNNANARKLHLLGGGKKGKGLTWNDLPCGHPPYCCPSVAAGRGA